MDVLLAQSDIAQGWVDVFQGVIAGGASLILAVCSALLGYAFYKQLKANSALEVDFRQQIKTDADTRADGQRDLMREMIDRDREAQETILTAMGAVESMSQLIVELRREIGEMRRELSDLRRDPRR